MRAKGSSVLEPFLRKLSENPNEHGEGAIAERIAQILMERLMNGEPVGDILKALDRTDGAVKTQIEHSVPPPIPPLLVRGADEEQMAAIRRLAGDVGGVNGSDT